MVPCLWFDHVSYSIESFAHRYQLADCTWSPTEGNYIFLGLLHLLFLSFADQHQPVSTDSNQFSQPPKLQSLLCYTVSEKRRNVKPDSIPKMQ